MTTREWVEEILAEMNPQAYLMEGLDDALIGVSADGRIAIYDEEKIISSLMDAQGIDEDSAWDWYGFNILGSYVGPGSPIIVRVR